MIGTDRTRKIARLRSYLQPSALDIKSLNSCKLTLSLINVLSVRITTDQYRTLSGNIYAVHQSFSGFNTGVEQPAFSTVVIGSVRVGTDV